MIGNSVSHYRMIDKLGQSGIGEVQRSKDANLQHHIINVLPCEFAPEEGRAARIQRETQPLASLRHPNMAGVEEANGNRPIIMVLVEEQTLGWVHGSSIGGSLGRQVSNQHHRIR